MRKGQPVQLEVMHVSVLAVPQAATQAVVREAKAPSAARRRGEAAHGQHPPHHLPVSVGEES